MDNDEEKPFLNDNIQELYRMVHDLDGRVAKLEKASVPSGQPSASPLPKFVAPGDQQSPACDSTVSLHPGDFVQQSPACDLTASMRPVSENDI